MAEIHDREPEGIELARPFAILLDSDAEGRSCEITIRQEEDNETIRISGTYEQQLDLFKDLVALLRHLETQEHPIDVRFF